jgi:hypothetical protein
MPENEQQSDLETAQEQGYIGQVAENPPNEVYTVKGQASGDQAEQEREAIRERRHQREDAIRDENKQADQQEPTQAAPTSKPPRSKQEPSS